MYRRSDEPIPFRGGALALLAATAFAPLALATEDEMRVHDVQLDLDEEARDQWPEILAELAAGGAVLHCAAGAYDDALIEEWYQRAIEVFGTVEDPRGQWYVDFVEGDDVEAASQELADRTGVEGVLPVNFFEPAGDLPPTTAPALGGGQSYFWNAHVSHVPTATGSLGGHALATLRGFGSGGLTVTTAIIEVGALLPPWNATRHEDLSSANLTVVLPVAGDDYTSPAILLPNDLDHGTATLGIHCADQDVAGNPTLGAGITGATPNATVYLIPFRSVQSGSHLPAAIFTALAQTPRPDVINMSLQLLGSNLPVAADPFTATAVALAVAQGVLVVEAAGNGSVNLDTAGIPNDGALWVGALVPATGARASFSNFGSQVQVCSFGQNVTTLGYGDASVGGAQAHERYTNLYNGTSSAAAITSAMIACAIDAWRTTFSAGVPAAPLQSSPTGMATDAATMYSALREYVPVGYGGNQFIGLFPDAQSLSRRLGQVPYGFGSSQGNGCAGGVCPVVPNLRPVWFSNCAGATIWNETAIGGSLTLRMDSIPSWAGTTSYVVVSAAPAASILPGMPGPVWIDLNQILQNGPVQPTGGDCWIGCGAPVWCGFTYHTFQIPNLPSLAGQAIYFQGAAEFQPGSYVGLTNGVKVTLQL
jgi:subtilisin family serine protease